MKQLFRYLAISIGTLTAVRVPIHGEVKSVDLIRSTLFYPAVGLLVGLIPYGILLYMPLSDNLTATLALVTWILVTGALHLDGWADCADAALAPWRGARNEPKAAEYSWRKSILKDPHIGTFGVASISLLLLLKWSLLTDLLLTAHIYSLLVATTVARSAAVIFISKFGSLNNASSPKGDQPNHIESSRIEPSSHTEPSSHLQSSPPTGLIAAFNGKSHYILASIIALVLVVIIGWHFNDLNRILLASVTGVFITHLFAKWLISRLGAFNGDVCGASIEMCEVVILAFLAF